jgi:hypothetical protein
MATVIKLKRGTVTPTTSDIVSGEVAVDTSAQKFYINDSGTIKEIGGGIGGGGSGNSFTTISVSGQSDISADSSTDTLTVVGGGLNVVTTDASTDTLTVGTSSGITFVKRNGTSTYIDPSTTGSTLGTAVTSLYIPFTTRGGTSKSTLVLA